MTRERDVDAAIRSVNPADLDAVGRLDLEAAGRELLSGIVTEPWEDAGRVDSTPRTGRRLAGAVLRPRRLALAASLCAAAAFLIVGLGSAGSPAPALGAARGRLAGVSPHVLLAGNDWHAEAAYRVGSDSGIVRFHRRGGWTFYLGGRLGIFTVQTAQLEWRSASAPARQVAGNAALVGTGTALGTRARIYERDARGYPDREYLATWTRSGREFVLRAVLPGLEDFERRLAALHLVDRDAWLAALPRHVSERRGLIASERWGEPPVRKVVISRCRDPLPDSVRAAAPGHIARQYERGCGPLQ